MSRKDRSRRPERRKSVRPLHRYLIVSEDSKSSRFYFQSFPHNPNLVEIVTEGGAGNTLSVVQRGVELQEAAKLAKTPYAHVYCVFDRDDHPVNRYRDAFALAHKHNDITAIWANECYELWLMLHFKFHHTGIERHKIYQYLKTQLGGYDKADNQCYENTKCRIGDALRNADRLLRHAQETDSHSPWMINPSTNIQDVVRKLIELNDLEIASTTP